MPHWTCARLGIPIAHGNTKGPVLLIGQQAGFATDADLSTWAERGLVLDAVSAGILLCRGHACGITAITPAQAPNSERFLANEFNGPYAGGAVALWSNQPAMYYRCQTAEGARVISSFRTAADGEWGPAVISCEDEQGRRFVVMAWDWCFSDNEWQTKWSHARRWQLQRLLGWVARTPLPVSLDAPNVHVMAHSAGKGRTVVSLLNGSFDPLKPVLRLNRSLGSPPQVELLGPEGEQVETVTAHWHDDGDARLLSLPCTLPALGVCIVSIKR